MFSRRLVVAFAALLFTPGCHASYSTSPTANLPVVALSVQYVVPIGPTTVAGAVLLRAYAVDSDHVYRDVTGSTSWISLNPSVVSVFSSGIVNLFRPGNATVTAVYQGLTQSVDFAVLERPPSPPFIRLSFPYLPPEVGETVSLRASYEPTTQLDQEVTDSAVWTSSDPRIATVSRGRVTAVAPGTAEITVTYNGFSTFYRLSVPPRRR
jgi:hypothetical protein